MPGSTERDRQHEVMRLLEEAGRVSVPDLAERFGVSLVTVRKDLERLEHLRPRGGVAAPVLVHALGAHPQQKTVPGHRRPPSETSA